MGVRLTQEELDQLGPKAREQIDAAADGNGDQDDSSSSTSKPSSSSSGTARRRARKAGKRAAAAARKPVRATGRRLGTLFVAALGLVLAYWALTNANAISLALKAPGAVLRWLADPTRSIPYAPGG